MNEPNITLRTTSQATLAVSDISTADWQFEIAPITLIMWCTLHVDDL